MAWHIISLALKMPCPPTPASSMLYTLCTFIIIPFISADCVKLAYLLAKPASVAKRLVDQRDPLAFGTLFSHSLFPGNRWAIQVQAGPAARTFIRIDLQRRFRLYSGSLKKNAWAFGDNHRRPGSGQLRLDRFTGLL